MSDTEIIIDEDYHVSFKERKTYFRLLVAASLVCILFLVICITLAVMYLQSVNKTEPTNHIVVEKPGKKYKICNGDDCFDLGKEIVHNMNLSGDPCKDFYAYSCGGWQQRHPLEDGQTMFSQFGILLEENYDVVKEALEEASFNEYSQNPALMKTVRFYNSCMDTSAMESQGIRPLINLTDEYGGFSLSNNYNPGVSIATRIGRAARELNVDSLIGVSTTKDPYDSSNTIIQMLNASQTFNDEIYLNGSWKVYIKEMLENSSFWNAYFVMKIIAVMDFESKLAEISSGLTPEAELKESIMKSIRDKTPFPDNRMTIKEFCKQSGFSCSFLKSTLQIIYGQSFSGDEKLLVANMTYFKHLNTLYQQTVAAGNTSVITDYIMWHVVLKYWNAAVSVYGGYDDCISPMLKGFDMTLGRLYVDAKFDDTSKKTVEEMTDDIRDAFIERLPNQTWMDSETRNEAKQKALAIKLSIGYPEYIKDDDKLEHHYKSLHVTDDFFENFKSMNHFIRMRDINTYGKPGNNEDWPDVGSPMEVNGFYVPTENRIIYLAGILQPPYFSPGYPRYYQYGALGGVIGHEITHGFDGQGRQYDKYGNYDNWWSDSADANFKERSSCFVKQYDKYEVFGETINGVQTLDENIADNAGIKIAYDAYQRWAAQNGTEKILPGLRLNPDQMFFVGFAQTWCSVYNRDGALYQLLTDEHSPDRYRVIGSLSNFDKFSQAFHCPTNSPMNPINKCAVW